MLLLALEKQRHRLKICILELPLNIQQVFVAWMKKLLSVYFAPDRHVYFDEMIILKINSLIKIFE